MIRITSIIMGAGLALATAAIPALADNIYEVEGARANARAGGPVSARDAELLNRWGALSGSPGWRHRYDESAEGGDYAYERRQYRQRPYRALR